MQTRPTGWLHGVTAGQSVSHPSSVPLGATHGEMRQRVRKRFWVAKVPDEGQGYWSAGLHPGEPVWILSLGIKTVPAGKFPDGVPLSGKRPVPSSRCSFGSVQDRVLGAYSWPLG